MMPLHPSNERSDCLNLASLANNARVLFATDEWFATAENLLVPFPPTFVPDLYCDQGKVMDGWETRRKRSEGHDWCVILLGGGENAERASSYVIHSIDVDTAYFTGNQAPRISLEVMRVTPAQKICREDHEDYLFTWMPGAVTRLARNGGIRGSTQSPSSIAQASKACNAVACHTTHGKSQKWIEILPITPLKPGYEESRHHSFQIAENVQQMIRELGGVTHLKLNYFPDGGVARIKVWGQKFQSCLTYPPPTIDVVSDRKMVHTTPRIHLHSSTDSPPSSHPYIHPELSSSIHGGLGLICSNSHYGSPSNLLNPTLGKDMGDGWETARHPDRPPIITLDPITGLQDTMLMDWSILKLGLGGAKECEGISRIIVDTRHFKGNFPQSVTIEGCSSSFTDETFCKFARSLESGDIQWFPLLNRIVLTGDAEHEFLREYQQIENSRCAVTHLKVSIYPDGGLSRVRIYGIPVMSMNEPRSLL